MQNSSSGLDLLLDSKSRIWGSSYDFEVRPFASSNLKAPHYTMALHNAIIPNQAYNVIAPYTNSFRIIYTSLDPATQSGGVTNHTITLAEGLYTPTTLATAMKTALDATAAGWSIPFTWTITYNSTTLTLDPTFAGGDVRIVARLNVDYANENKYGHPKKTPTARFAEMVGWEIHTMGLPNVSSIRQIGVLATSGRTPLALSGSDYVDITCNIGTSFSVHCNPEIQNLLARIPLGALYTVFEYERSTDMIETVVSASNLNNIRITLWDEWGNPFVLPDTQTVAIGLRLFPIQSS